MKKTPVLLAALALVLAACGSADDEGAAAETTVADSTATTEAMSETTEAMAEAGTIVDVASDAGTFTTLLQAAEVAGLVDTLNGEGPYTVFAPTDEAFAALDPATLEALLADPEALSQVLLYHVVSGEVMAADVVGLESASTVEGSDLPITVDGDVVMVGDATVVTTDIEASNGVIHEIDQVLIPPSE